MSSQTFDCGAMKVENFSTTSCADTAPAEIASAIAVAAWTAHRVIAIEVSVALSWMRPEGPGRAGAFPEEYIGTPSVPMAFGGTTGHPQPALGFPPAP